MDFALFLIVNATLFIRPAEIVPDLIGLPIYNAIIVLNLAAAAFKVSRRLTASNVRAEPITACVLGLLASIFLSHASHLDFFRAREDSVEFFKVVLYYLLLVAVLDTPSRLRGFLAALVLYISVLTGLALLHYHGIINIPSLEAFAEGEVDASTGEPYVVMRLCSTGIYHDPNDLSLILIVGLGACVFLASPRPAARAGPMWQGTGVVFLRALTLTPWLAPGVVFLYALTLTHSRGGFLALLAGMMVLFYARFGARKAAVLATMALPAMFVLFAGRQTNISASDDTGQDRIQIWAAGFTMLRESPLFGVGQNVYAERAGLVAHNSYVHGFGELGLLGGSLFLGAFAYAVGTLLALGRHAGSIADPDLRRLRPFLLAIVVGYAFGMLTLTRNTVVPTYMILGLVTAYLRLASADAPRLAGAGGPIAAISRRLVGRMMLASLAFLVVANVFIKLFVRWG